ncbi:YceI family protein [Chitinophagaceae bacterium LB-8]|uniref:YceI family protein n=1 Tax=Paraflavisolibacter caeni TaxID=2982496 RepID=A0A9X3B962_9BACT|nr:YceI family protein [Paraflavisolibacter caeni]MCU7550686.1 YceI family protein [Paraflavisolibacter caeni]
MKKTVIIALALVASFAGFAQTWNIDKSHSKLNFTVTHLLISDVEGSFKNINSTFTSSKADFSDAVIELTADVNSINTDDENRDKHLKSPDFFDAAKYNALTFKSKSFKNVGGKKYKLAGDLTMHGVTKPVVLDVVYNGSAVHPYSKKTVAGFKISGTLKRSEFGVGTATPTAVVGDEVALVANAEFIKD